MANHALVAHNYSMLLAINAFLAQPALLTIPTRRNVHPTTNPISPILTQLLTYSMDHILLIYGRIGIRVMLLQIIKVTVLLLLPIGIKCNVSAALLTTLTSTCK